MFSSHRRAFLRTITVGLVSGQMVSANGLLRKGDAEETRGDLPTDSEPVTRCSWALGSEVTLTAWHADAEKASVAIDAAFATLSQIDRLMSIYRPESPLRCLNREGLLSDPHPFLLAVLREAESMSRRSDGAFDVTVQPLWELFAQAKSEGELPSEMRIEQARRCVGWRRVECTPSQIRLQGDGTALTLNGIGQGFAADRVADTLRAHGVQHALINTGEVRALGGKPAVGEWKVGIQHPRREDAFVAVTKLAGRSLATSGDYATSFSDDFTHHHLFDPRTGRSPAELASVSIAAPSATLADALSTAIFVLGAQRGLELIRSYPQTDALLVCKDGTQLATNAFPV